MKKLKLSPAQAKFLADRPGGLCQFRTPDGGILRVRTPGRLSPPTALRQCAAAISWSTPTSVRRTPDHWHRRHPKLMVSATSPSRSDDQDLSDMEIYVLRSCLEGSTVCGQLHFDGMDKCEETLAYNRAQAHTTGDRRQSSRAWWSGCQRLRSLTCDPTTTCSPTGNPVYHDHPNLRLLYRRRRRPFTDEI